MIPKALQSRLFHILRREKRRRREKMREERNREETRRKRMGRMREGYNNGKGRG